MGLMWNLVNKKNKTFYDLAKGSWHELIGNKDYLTDLEVLKEFVFDDMFNGYDDPNFSDTGESKRDYTDEIAQEMFEFCSDTDLSDLELVSDAGGQLPTGLACRLVLCSPYGSPNFLSANAVRRKAICNIARLIDRSPS
jgi:hypothetical protein